VGIALFDHPNSKNEEYTDTDNAITGLAWSPNGKYLLSGNNADQVILQVVL
jgi:WD40 repeat protein